MRFTRRVPISFAWAVAAILALAPPVLAADPGVSIPSSSAPSDQKAGSVLLFPVYTSSASNSAAANTRITITNTSDTSPVAIRLLFVAEAGNVASNFICLTKNQTATFLASDVDPGVTGYIVAVAIDTETGCPMNFNFLIGDLFVKFASGHAANLGALAVAAIDSGRGLAGCDSSDFVADLVFDGKKYNKIPRVIASSGFGSNFDGNNTLLIVNRLGGNLAIGAATVGTVFGVLYDDAENAFAFQLSSGNAQLRGSLSSSFPNVIPDFNSVIPSGRSGWLKLFSLSDNAYFGAMITFNPNAAAQGNAFNGGHNLHALKVTTGTVRITVPVFPPSC